jgi:hypothetical protein
MIEHLSEFPDYVVARVTPQADYETVLVPVVKALEQHEKVRSYYQIDLDFSGVGRGVAQNCKSGMGHLLRRDRIAIVRCRLDPLYVAHVRSPKCRKQSKSFRMMKRRRRASGYEPKSYLQAVAGLEVRNSKRTGNEVIDHPMRVPSTMVAMVRRTGER